MTNLNFKNHSDSTDIGVAVQQVLVNVVLGRESKDCENYGVCRVDYPNQPITHRYQADTRTGTCNKALAVLSMLPSGTFELAFIKAAMSDACRKKYFSESYFRVEENFSLPQHILADLEVPKVAVTKGAYPMKNSLGFYLIRF